MSFSASITSNGGTSPDMAVTFPSHRLVVVAAIGPIGRATVVTGPCMPSIGILTLADSHRNCRRVHAFPLCIP